MTARLWVVVRRGTNARFAWQEADGTPLGDIATLPTADHATLADPSPPTEVARPRGAAIARSVSRIPITGDQIG